MAKLREIIDKQKLYYSNIDILDYIFASYKGGRDAKPLLIGAVTENKLNSRIDIQLFRVQYKMKDYLKIFIGSFLAPKCAVCDIPQKSESDCIDHLMQYHQALVQSYYPVFLQS